MTARSAGGSRRPAGRCTSIPCREPGRSPARRPGDQRATLIGLGPSVSVAFVDNRTMRVGVGVHWTPFISSDWGRVSGDFEFSYKLFTLSIVAGRASDGPFGNQRAGITLGGFAGIRFAW